MLPKQPNQSLIDGLACLQALAVGHQMAGVRSLARELDLEPTRVHRLLKTLAHLGLAEQTAAGKYRPGPGVHVLAAQALYGSGLVRVATPILDRLTDSLPTGVLVALGVLWRDQVCYLYHGSRAQMGAAALGHSHLYPATRSGIGMVLLAQQPESTIRQLYNHREIPGFSGISNLLDELRQLHAAGYADLTRAKNDRAVAVAISANFPAALTLAGPLNSHTAQQVSTLRAVASEIHQALTSYLKGS
ncbi:MAG: helix-turn-helix domain-containing protein [Phycisphaerae bacterium]